jgi:phosphoglycerate dehydrogenase-like enzyme
LALAHARRLPAALARQAEGRWARDGAVGTVLRGRTLGVVGLGTIGTEVARRAAAFGMRVWGVRRSGAPVAGVDRVVAPDRLDEVLRLADYLALTLPLTPETRGLIGARELALLPRGAFVVNVGRGGLVDETALAEAIAAGRLGGAGLDVFEQEPLPASSPLWRLPGVIITPHVGGSSPGFLDRAVPFFCENLKRYLSGEPLLNRVDVTRGY